MSQSVTLHFNCPECDTRIQLEAEVDPGEILYGTDADGNRGLYLGPSIEPPDIPLRCSNCSALWDTDQLQYIREQLDRAADDFDFGDY